ncbi:regulatory protein RecX [Marinobacter lacisalsi]|uniref:Regulatory protein RecX n=1 Tax=Marinobacter lacisalsi TaxID=475979 RepID=A0ABV8QMQ6_9GAMM
MAKSGKKKDPNEQAPETALRLLARREHSRLELTMKLRQRRVDNDVIDEVLDSFEEKGWLDDGRFAEVFVRQRMDAGYGPLKILADLQQRGVMATPPELNAVPEERWTQMAIRLRERRFGLADLTGDWAEWQRQGGFLARRGFSGDQVERALEATEQAAE